MAGCRTVTRSHRDFGLADASGTDVAPIHETPAILPGDIARQVTDRASLNLHSDSVLIAGMGVLQDKHCVDLLAICARLLVTVDFFQRGRITGHTDGVKLKCIAAAKADSRGVVWLQTRLAALPVYEPDSGYGDDEQCRKKNVQSEFPMGKMAINWLQITHFVLPGVVLRNRDETVRSDTRGCGQATGRSQYPVKPEDRT